MTDVAEGLWAAYHATRAVADRNRLAEHYLPLVRKIADRLHARLPPSVDVGDLEGVGAVGLLAAIEAFDPARGVKFETYAGPRVLGAMLDDLRRLDSFPRLIRARVREVTAAADALAADLGRQPNPAELAAHLGVPDGDLDALLAAARRAVVMNIPASAPVYAELPCWAHVRDPRAGEFGRHLQTRDAIRLAARGLPRDDRLILAFYFAEDLTMKEIGHCLGLSESRVSQRLADIVARLRVVLADRKAEFDPAA